MDIKNVIEKLEKEDYVRTYFIVARMTYEVTGEFVDMIVPVNVYEHYEDGKNKGIGAEIVDIAALASQCKWDMEKVNIKADGEYTHIDGNLMKEVEETPSAGKIRELCGVNTINSSEQKPATLSIAKYVSPQGLQRVVSNIKDSYTSAIDELELRVKKLEEELK